MSKQDRQEADWLKMKEERDNWKQLYFQALEVFKRADGWKDGVPPDFTGCDCALVVVELPSLFKYVNCVSYKAILWNGKAWSNTEAYRARRWREIPFPDNCEKCGVDNN